MQLLFLLATLPLYAAFLPINRQKFILSSTGVSSSSTLLFGARNRAWAKGDLSDKDIFEEEGGESKGTDKKDKFKLEPEIVFFEGPPSLSEVFLPALSVLTVIGIVPFVAALSRQVWVRYKFTSRRLAIQSGIGGKTQTEIIYPDIDEIRFGSATFPLSPFLELALFTLI